MQDPFEHISTNCHEKRIQLPIGRYTIDDNIILMHVYRAVALQIGLGSRSTLFSISYSETKPTKNTTRNPVSSASASHQRGKWNSP